MATTERGQWTIKSRRLDGELQTACRMAAERQGMPVGDWCAEALRAASRAVLTGDRPGAAPPPPARIEDVRDALMGEVERRMVELVERLAPRPEAVPHAASQPAEAVPQPVPQPASRADDREARRLRTMLRRGRGRS